MIHKFEEKGLGTAPFKFVTAREGGGCCDYCGTRIKWEAVVEDANGERFVVGSDCIKKVGDKGLYNPVLRAMNAQKKRISEDAAIAKRKALQPRYDEALEVLARRPHPIDGFAAMGSSLADHYRAILPHSIWTSQQPKAVRLMREAIAEATRRAAA